MASNETVEILRQKQQEKEEIPIKMQKKVEICEKNRDRDFNKKPKKRK